VRSGGIFSVFIQIHLLEKHLLVGSIFYDARVGILLELWCSLSYVVGGGWGLFSWGFYF